MARKSILWHLAHNLEDESMAPLRTRSCTGKPCVCNTYKGSSIVEARASGASQLRDLGSFRLAKPAVLYGLRENIILHAGHSLSSHLHVSAYRDKRTCKKHGIKSRVGTVQRQPTKTIDEIADPLWFVRPPLRRASRLCEVQWPGVCHIHMRREQWQPGWLITWESMGRR